MRPEAESKDPENASPAMPIQGVLFQNACATIFRHARWLQLRVLGLHPHQPLRHPLRWSDRLFRHSHHPAQDRFHRKLHQKIPGPSPCLLRELSIRSDRHPPRKTVKGMAAREEDRTDRKDEPALAGSGRKLGTGNALSGTVPQRELPEAAWRVTDSRDSSTRRRLRSASLRMTNPFFLVILSPSNGSYQAAASAVP